ncbi:MAG TPA: DNA primase, partial [Candidatus Manganitrophaceae bacterium]
MNERRISDQLIETIRDRNDLVSLVSEYFALKKSGQNYTGLCPFHSEKTPSFVVSPVKQIFHCFGCGVGGNVFQFLMKIEGFSFPEALERLAEKGGVPLPASSPRRGEGPAVREADQIYQLNEAVAAYLHKNLLEKPEAARATAYLKERGIDAETINAFSIGFALPRRDDLLKRFGKTFPVSLLEKAGLVSKKSGEGSSSGEADYFDRFRNRVIFPIRTLQGKVVGFGGRVLDDALPKYLNTPETAVYTKGKHLFALDQAKKKGARSLIIVEGYFDAIMAHQAGVHNVVATLGTSLTEDHLQLIRRIAEKVTLIFDPDDAGVRAA